VHRILKARGLIPAPAHIFLSTDNEFANKTGFMHRMWQTDFAYFKIHESLNGLTPAVSILEVAKPF
jgi:hypothetical protein